ncbi:hypothetical protein MMC07_006880 [Pseudocyphellaria aurata]|nr:hypothetical protein [Pseudocyphellaria aurata]
MQIAAILSDLTSLRVCDHAAAMSLVTAKPKPQSSPSPPRPSSSSSSSSFNEKEEEDEDVDLRRATDLLELHYGLKMRYVQQQGGAGAGAAGAGAGAAGAGGGLRGERVRGEKDKMDLKQARRDVEEVLTRLKKGVPGEEAAA